MKHFQSEPSNFELKPVKVGEYFTWFDGRHYRKMLRISTKFHIPIGLRCETLAGAQKQN